jgi:hypothetical protein
LLLTSLALATAAARAVTVAMRKARFMMLESLVTVNAQVSDSNLKKADF